LEVLCCFGAGVLGCVRDAEFDSHEHIFCRDTRSRPVRVAPSFVALRRVESTAEVDLAPGYQTGRSVSRRGL